MKKVESSSIADSEKIKDRSVSIDQECEIGLRDIVSLEESDIEAAPTKALVRVTSEVQLAYDRLLILTILNKEISLPVLELLRYTNHVLVELKTELRKRFESPEIQCIKPEFAPSDHVLLSAQRICHLLNQQETPHLLDTYKLQGSDGSTILFLPPDLEGILAEAVSLFHFKNDLAGVKVIRTENGRIVEFFMYETPEILSKISIKIGPEDDQEIGDLRRSKKILIAVEGDIAGHAIRALHTARGLRNLGYEPMFVGNGYYIQQFIAEGFTQLPPIVLKGNQERVRIIQQTRGEGKGVLFWGFKQTGEMIALYKESLRPQVESGLDLLVCDMNPIADIALNHLQQGKSQRFPSLSQTHDIHLSPTRILRSLKTNSLPVGELLFRAVNLPLLKTLDRQNYRYAINHFLFNQLADTVVGLPLFLNDYMGRKNWRNEEGPKRRIKFTDYLYGIDGTIQFSLKPPSSRSVVHSVGMSERGDNINLEPEAWEAQIPTDKPVVLNMQGSTYNQEAWDIIFDAMSSRTDIFSIHGTGKREDLPEPIFTDSDQEGDRQNSIVGYKAGYLPGYRLAKSADVVINHGGFGTISQWILSVADRITEDKATLSEMLGNGASDEEIVDFLSGCKGASRSLAVCNTFEQENNALVLNETGGDLVCTVMTADNLLRTADAGSEVNKVVTNLLTSPMSKMEKSFWIQAISVASMMNAPAHAALILERILILNSKAEVAEPKKLTPYDQLSMGERITQSVLEVPTALRRTMKQLRSKEHKSDEAAQRILLQALHALDFNDQDEISDPPQIGSYLGKGFESEVFTFTISDRKWVIKIGTGGSFSIGIVPSSSKDHADLLRWNYEVVSQFFGSSLPHVLPKPYYVLSAGETEHPGTIQVSPFIDRIRNLKELPYEQIQALRDERRLFFVLSQELQANKRVIPDLVNPRNLSLGLVDKEPHVVLIDLGLVHLNAPTPVLNMLAPISQKVAYAVDSISLRLGQKKSE